VPATRGSAGLRFRAHQINKSIAYLGTLSPVRRGRSHPPARAVRRCSPRRTLPSRASPDRYRCRARRAWRAATDWRRRTCRSAVSPRRGPTGEAPCTGQVSESNTSARDQRFRDEPIRYRHDHRQCTQRRRSDEWSLLSVRRDVAAHLSGLEHHAEARCVLPVQEESRDRRKGRQGDGPGGSFPHGRPRHELFRDAVVTSFDQLPVLKLGRTLRAHAERRRLPGERLSAGIKCRQGVADPRTRSFAVRWGADMKLRIFHFALTLFNFVLDTFLRRAPPRPSDAQ
jgi:hypothetical protein